jgi:hypothetical protein
VGDPFQRSGKGRYWPTDNAGGDVRTSCRQAVPRSCASRTTFTFALNSSLPALPPRVNASSEISTRGGMRNRRQVEASCPAPQDHRDPESGAEIQRHSKPVIENCYREFLLNNNDPEDREYPDAEDQIREVLVYGNYLSQKDIEFCLGFDFGGLHQFEAIEKLHQSLRLGRGTDRALTNGCLPRDARNRLTAPAAIERGCGARVGHPLTS